MTELSVLSHKQLMFIDYEVVARELLPDSDINNIKYKMLIVFKSLLKHKAWKYELHKDLNGSCLAMGEKVCLNLSFVLAARQILNITVPLDYSVASGLLDKELQLGLNDYFNNQ